MKYVLLAVAVLAVVLGMAWAFQGNDFFMYKFFAPKYEQTRRQVFEQTRSYRVGMVQELQNMQFEYVKTDSAHKPALASIILHRAAEFDQAGGTYPPDLKAFIDGLRANRQKTL